MSISSLNSYAHLLNKCKQENISLISCETHPEYDYLMFNLVFGLNHLFEWFLKENEITNDVKILCIKEFNPYLEKENIPKYLKTLYEKINTPIETNQCQAAIRKLCNNAKHFNPICLEVQRKNYTCYAREPLMECGELTATAGSFDHYKYSVNINDIDMDLDKLIDAQIKAWDSFIETAM